ncbi:ubiquinol-cytochrome C chaperone family protein [Segnochrobactrum spirostomi]|uniref:Ubiquinol-cytochrome C chaperone n=1 Tax=Segnochrobactrum spirostomi TaxID=2608987 RepID=A0A6A7Y417_9HYPH|nr:ubiquinol-cytochrome C chaperone family protein [Segnochrobactrum spirostomi]MQT13863.1 ubiquinol-cytochrome C chaperone [Segnochrobactrum spirostomi]
MIFKLFRRNEPEPFALYGAIVAQARQPTFYTSFAVPDTLDGRFDMVVLHIVLICRRLRGPGGADETGSQALFDLFMRDMDRSLREMGVGDTAVPKRIKKMIAAFYGRLSAYVAALDSGDLDDLAAAIARNIFPDAERPGESAALAAYAAAAAHALEASDDAAIADGRIAFPALDPFLPGPEPR